MCIVTKTRWARILDKRSHPVQYSQFEDHVEHPLGAVRLEQLNDMRVLQFVADTSFSLQI